MKATHQGECQVCGRTQKLPNGKLSKHGYTTRCGFFEGVCFGADHLPFEQDKSLVDEAIERAEIQLANLKKSANDILKSTDCNNVTNECYGDFGRRGRSEYRSLDGRVEEREVEINGMKFKNFHFMSMFGGQPYETKLRWSGMGNTLESVVKYLNEQESERILRIAQRVENYLSWQRRRIKDWKPRPLTPVKTVV